MLFLLFLLAFVLLAAFLTWFDSFMLRLEIRACIRFWERQCSPGE